MGESAKQRTQNGNIYDYIGTTYPTGTTEVFVYKIGGASGQTVETITIVYTDSTKEFVSSVTIT